MTAPAPDFTALAAENDRMREALEEVGELVYMLPPADRVTRELAEVAARGLGEPTGADHARRCRAAIVARLAREPGGAAVHRRHLVSITDAEAREYMDAALAELLAEGLIAQGRPNHYRRFPAAQLPLTPDPGRA